MPAADFGWEGGGASSSSLSWLISSVISFNSAYRIANHRQSEQKADSTHQQIIFVNIG